MTAMPPHHPDARDITGIRGMCGCNDAGKSDRNVTSIGEPPMPLRKIRHGSCIKKYKAVEFSQNVRNILVLTICSTDTIHFARL